MKTYHGYRVAGGCVVEVHCEALVVRSPKLRAMCLPEDDSGETKYFLPSRCDLAYHFPGFEWGKWNAEASAQYGTTPAAQLQFALALLADAIGDDKALECYEHFQDDVASRLHDRWELSEDDIMAWHRAVKAHAQEASAELEVCG